MRIKCCITKARGTHPEYVMLIAFPRQHWLRERASMLRYDLLFCKRHTYYTEKISYSFEGMKPVGLFSLTLIHFHILVFQNLSNYRYGTTIFLKV
jgi:hypothetical protein